MLNLLKEKPSQRIASLYNNEQSCGFTKPIRNDNLTAIHFQKHSLLIEPDYPTEAFAVYF